MKWALPCAPDTLGYGINYGLLIAIDLESDNQALMAFKCGIHQKRKQLCRFLFLMGFADDDNVSGFDIFLDRRELIRPYKTR
jgi:hypothetical protein